MKEFSTRQAAKKLGITQATLSRYVAAGKVPTPKVVSVGTFRVHSWSEEEVEQLRKLLPKIANGRKTRYKKQSAKTKTPARTPVPHKQRKPKKK
jgi:predicted DNA-binding transcriptional regulator AlpA